MSSKEYKFENAVGPYDCSRGRREYGDITKVPHKPIVRLFEVRLDAGGYDNGGAYWGLGLPLYCAVAPDTSESTQDAATDYRAFVRADNREAAQNLLGILDCQLARPTRSKYEVLYIVQGYYPGNGWEDLAPSATVAEARNDLKAYRENEPGTPVRLITRRTLRHTQATK